MAAGTTRRRGADVLTRLSSRRDHTSQDRFARTEIASPGPHHSMVSLFALLNIKRFGPRRHVGGPRSERGVAWPGLSSSESPPLARRARPPRSRRRRSASIPRRATRWQPNARWTRRGLRRGESRRPTRAAGIGRRRSPSGHGFRRAANILEGSPRPRTGPATGRAQTRSATELGQPGGGRPYWSHPCMVKPPDTLMTCPVMKLASSLARKATMPGMSSGWPRRFRGIARLRPS